MYADRISDKVACGGVGDYRGEMSMGRGQGGAEVFSKYFFYYHNYALLTLVCAIHYYKTELMVYVQI